MHAFLVIGTTGRRALTAGYRGLNYHAFPEGQAGRTHNDETGTLEKASTSPAICNFKPVISDMVLASSSITCMNAPTYIRRMQSRHCSFNS